MGDLITLIQDTFGFESRLDQDTPLLTSGLIDSFDLVELLATLEARYGVALEPGDVSADTFDTPTQIWAHIDQEVG